MLLTLASKPLAAALNLSRKTDRSLTKSLVEMADSRAGRDRARELVRADEAISSTRETAVGYLADAQASIAGLPANPAVDAMLTTCDLLVERLDRTT